MFTKDELEFIMVLCELGWTDINMLAKAGRKHPREVTHYIEKFESKALSILKEMPKKSEPPKDTPDKIVPPSPAKA